MKINVDANSFCPNDCPYFELSTANGFRFDGKVITKRICRHQHICKFAVDQYRNKVEEVCKDCGTKVEVE